MPDCVELARQLAARVGKQLAIPVYLYGAAATRADRRRLPDIRRGEYEGLPDKLARSDFKPDFGPAVFNERAGATVIGARHILIAWNVNLDTQDPHIAEAIAAELRESGKFLRDGKNKVVRDKNGKPTRVHGRFSALQGRGWHIEEYGCAQVSFNVLDYRVTPLHEVYAACCSEATRHGVRVVGSELVGLVPLEALLRAGDYTLASKPNASRASEAQRLEAAIEYLGLGSVRSFDPQDRVIEYKIDKLLA